MKYTFNCLDGLATLQEFRLWGANLNSVIYQGEKESRTMIRNYEFYTEGRMPLFDALVTSYDLAMLDNGLLQKFDWSCIIGLYLSTEFLMSSMICGTTFLDGGLSNGNDATLLDFNSS